MGSDDEKARKARADELRMTIGKASRGGIKGGVPGHAPTPRELTDEAARKAREEAERAPPGKE